VSACSACQPPSCCLVFRLPSASATSCLVEILQVSLEKLKEHVASFPLRCEVKAKDQYGRNVAACKMLAGRLSEDLGIWMVSNGYAVAYRYWLALSVCFLRQYKLYRSCGSCFAPLPASTLSCWCYTESVGVT